MKYLITVIVPVFNTEKYLAESIESVLNQTEKAIEIILVDDGSSDGSLKLIQRYASKHSRISYLTQERKRQGAARNLALGIAQGKYIVFLDSDDRLPADACEKMYLEAEKSKSEMVAGIQQSFSTRRKWVGVSIHSTLFSRKIEKTTIEAHPELIEDISACNRMLSRDFIEKHQLFFPEGTAGEDLDFMSRVYLYAEKISILPEVVYQYRGRQDSRTSRISKLFFQDRVAVVEGLQADFEAKGKQAVYQKLVSSEVRKLVGNRFGRVLRELPYEEQLEVFEIIALLAVRLNQNDIQEKGFFTLGAQIRIILLKFKLYDALIAYEASPYNNRFLPLIKNDEARSALFEPLLTKKLCSDKSDNFGLTEYNAGRKFLDNRALNLISRKIEKLLGLGIRLRRSGILPLLKYLVLFPVVKLTSRFSNSEDIWLMDERVSRSAEDNGYFFFKFMREKHPQVKLFYVIDSHSPHRQYVEPLGNVVSKYSFKHAYFLHRAKVLLSTDAFRSLAYPYEVVRSWRRKTHNVFLQHGVAGNKTTTYTRKNYPYFSQIITSNSIESEFFAKTPYDFEADQISETGMARLDNLVLDQGVPKRMILVAPTWRKWIKGGDSIKASKYFSAWHSFICSEELVSLLERENVDLYFRPHFNMMKFIGEFESSSERIKICLDHDIPLHFKIKECAMLITDYSSVMYDFFYQEKPVITYMFDRSEWEEQPPGAPHLDYETDLASDIVMDYDALMQQLKEQIAQGFQMTQQHRLRVDKLFSHRDNQNCERIYQSTIERVGGLA